MKSDYQIPFLDLLFNLTLLFSALFILSFILIKVKNDEANLQPKVEFMIEMEWPDQSLDDVDGFLEADGQHLIYFQHRQNARAGAFLDRDDLGDYDDKITLPSGQVIEYKHNKEIYSIKCIIPVEYVFNVFMYNKRDTVPTEVTATLIKMNPYRIIHQEKATLLSRGEERTAFRFTVTKDGEITNINDLSKEIAIEATNYSNRAR